jgi:transcriptional regulator with XRE-family HTH domain
MALAIEELGRLIVAKRGHRGVRATAAEVGVSPATLSRVENGHMPDLETFARICKWLDVDPNDFLGTKGTRQQASTASVHFRKDKTLEVETAKSLANLILAAQAALRAKRTLEG